MSYLPITKAIAGGLGTSTGELAKHKHVDDFEREVERGALFAGADYHKRTTAMTLAPPRDIFFAALIFPILHRPADVMKKALKPSQLFRVTSALVAAWAQFVAIYYVFVIASTIAATHDANGEARCSAGSSADWLRLACLGTFVSMIFFELRATAQWWMWIALLPTWDPKHEAVLNQLEAGFAMRKVVVTGSDGVQYRKTEVAAGGVTGFFRAFMRLVCLLKVLMEVAALVAGAA